MDFHGRRKRLAKACGLGSVLVSSPSDLLYLTGYKSESALLLVRRDGSALLFASTLDNELEQEPKGVEVVFARDSKAVMKHLSGSVGFDENSMKASTFLRMKRAGIKLRHASVVLSRIRAVKDDEEIGLIKKAVAITKHGFDVSLCGMTEADAQREVAARLIRHGSDPNLPYEIIIASGANSYFVHHAPGPKLIRRGELVVQDSGARYGGYCADVTRTYHERCGAKEKRIVEDVLEMKEEITGHAAAGSTMKELNGLYARLMKRKGYKLMHGIGHGVGLDVHEDVPGKLQRGMVITVEPGIYEKGIGGCRFEDMLLITGGRPRNLTAGV